MNSPPQRKRPPAGSLAGDMQSVFVANQRIQPPGVKPHRPSAEDLARAKRLFAAARHELEAGDVHEAGRLLTEWARLTGRRGGGG